MIKMEEKIQQISIRKKRGIWIFLGFWLFIMFWCLRLLSGYLISRYFGPDSFYSGFIEFIIITIVSLLLEALILYFIDYLITKNWKGYSLKGYLKIPVAIFIILFVIIVPCFYYVAFYDDVNIEYYNVEYDSYINYKKYNRKNPKCYEKCKKAYKGDKNIPWKYVDHLNYCESVCIEPRWNACIENCKLTTLWEELKWKYNYENYENWFKNKYPGNDPVSFADAMKNGWFVSHDILKGERQYRQWINEVFSWHKDEVKKYELCEESCGSAPKYTFIN